MPASIKSIREAMTVGPTPHDKGLQLTITVKAYDTGMVEVDGRPINQYLLEPEAYDQGHGWLGAAEYVILSLNELRRQAAARRAAARSRLPGS